MAVLLEWAGLKGIVYATTHTGVLVSILIIGKQNFKNGALKLSEIFIALLTFCSA
jgi:hypothetical protein